MTDISLQFREQLQSLTDSGEIERIIWEKFKTEILPNFIKDKQVISKITVKTELPSDIQKMLEKFSILSAKNIIHEMLKAKLENTEVLLLFDSKNPELLRIKDFCQEKIDKIEEMTITN